MTIDRLAQLGEERAQGIDKEVRGVKDGVQSVKELVTGKRWTDSRSCRSSAERPVLGGPYTTVERTLCAGSWATDHADDLSAALQQECDDLVTRLEMTTDHADALEADLQNQVEGLARHSQFIRETLGRYVSEDVVAQLLDVPEGLELGVAKRKVTILMSDMRGFTALAEYLEPQEVMTFLNRYLEAMVDVILAYRGTIIEILGDGLLVLFGAPLSRDDDAERAVACALAMQLRIADTNTLHRQAGLAGSRHGHWHSHWRGGGQPNCTWTSRWQPLVISSYTSCVPLVRWCEEKCLPKWSRRCPKLFPRLGPASRRFPRQPGHCWTP